MIKVNLNKTKNSVIYNTKDKEVTSVDSVFSTVVSKLKSQGTVDFNTTLMAKITVKLILLLCFPLGLKAYEINQINQLETLKQQKEELLNTTNQKLSQLKDELTSYDYLQAKAKEYEGKKNFLKELAESRLIIPRTLELIQSKVPNTVWLNNLSLRLSKEEGQKLSLSGQSFNEAHVNFFAHSLRDILNKNSITVDTHDVKEGDSVVKVNFKLNAVM